MNSQQMHSIFTENLVAQYINELTGEDKEPLVGKVPEDKYIVGQLSPSVDDSNFLTSRTIINAIGINFNIGQEMLDECELNVKLCGNLFYRVYPSYEEQKEKLIQEFNNMFGKAYSSIESFMSDAEIAEQIWDKTKNAPNNNCTISILNKYRKISLEDFGLYVNIKLSEVYNQKLGLGYIDEGSKCNIELNNSINNIIMNFVVNQPDYYKYETKEKISIYDLITEEKWSEYIGRQVKEARVIPNWALCVNAEIRKISDLINIEIKFVNKSKQAETELASKRKKEHTHISTIFNARLKVEIIHGQYIPIKLEHFKDDYKYDKTQPAVGFNCNIDFEDLHDSKDHLATTNIPIFRQYRLKTNDSIPARFSDLINDPIAVLEKISDGMRKELSGWQEVYNKKKNDLSNEAIMRMENEISDFEIEITRFEIGIRLIREYSIVRKAFISMNQAFMNSPKSYEGWRLFQIVYIVSIILDIVTTDEKIDLPESIREKSTFDNVDIIYFPTGGGKTEAFLGTVVFTLFFDRLRGKNMGVSSIIRYPLRLLAAQQASRVADILAQAELIRRSNDEMSSDP